MILMLFLAALLWIGGGMLLQWWKARPSGGAFQRSVAQSVVAVGSEVEVRLRLIPPAAAELVAQPHDVVLIIDRSSSMRDGPGSPLWAAMRAAESFVRRCPDQVHIGLVVFNDGATVLSGITPDHAAIVHGVATISGGGGTSIDKALAAAVDVVQEAAGRADIHKTAILLSDGASNPERVLLEAARLRESARIVTVGFGPAADVSLLRQIAGDNGHYCHVVDAGDLSSLFGVLAAFVSGDLAAAGVVSEPANAPAPFDLARLGDLSAVTVRREPQTTIAWSVPVMDLRAVQLTYVLVPECPGWHNVARGGGRATWRFQDQRESVTEAPSGPRVLVLPAALGWAWPILNPFFWLIFGRLFCRSHRAAPDMPVVDTPPLVLPTLPKPLEAPHPALYETKVRPALVVGVGEVGEWAVTHLKHRLADRNSGKGVAFLAVRANPYREGKTPAVGVSQLAEDERIGLEQDLRPYLESLRAGGSPPSRRWIPVIEWLARLGPRTTGWISDRREARLALLQRPQRIDSEVQARIEAMKAQPVEPAALLVGSAHDAECSGMLAELAHLLSMHDAQNTAIISMRTLPEIGDADQMEAFGRELERMLLMRGDEVLSDRQEPPAAARQLLDRLVVLHDDSVDVPDTGRAIADLVWSFLAYPEVARRMPTAKADTTGQQMEVCVVDSDFVHLPSESLWNWVRTQALAKVINGLWLDLRVSHNRLEVPPAPRETVARWVRAFWSPAAASRPPGLLIRSGGALLGDAVTDANLAVLQSRLPAAAVYEEQVDFADAERRAYAAFIEQWAQSLLDEAYQNRKWGLVLLLTATREVEDGIRLVQQRLQDSSLDSDAVRVSIALYSDLSGCLERFRRDVEGWIAALAGNQLDLGIAASTAAPVCDRIEQARAAAEADVLFPSDAVRADALRREAAWYQQYGAALLAQLRFKFIRDSARPHLVLELAGHDHQLSPELDLLVTLDAFLAPFHDAVLDWSLHETLAAADVSSPTTRFRVGLASARRYQAVAEVADESDPYVAAALCVQRVSLDNALAVKRRGWRRLPYAWPEEANAGRIADLVTNVLERRTQPFSPSVVHLLRDTTALYGLLADFAQNHVFVRGERSFVLRRGVEYWIGAAPDTLSQAAALKNFETIVRQAALLKRSIDAASIPDRDEPWSPSPAEAIERIETNPAIGAAVTSAGWPMWQDIIRGVILSGARDGHVPPGGERAL